MLQSLKNVISILGIDHCSERHRVEEIDIISLVGLKRSGSTRLEFQHSPSISIEAELIRNSLEELLIILQQHNIWKEKGEVLIELFLESPFRGLPRHSASPETLEDVWNI